MAKGKKTAGTEGGAGGTGDGGDEDDDDDDTLDVDGTDDDDDDDEDDDDEYVPPTKAELTKMQAALAKANAQAKKYRLRAQGKRVEDKSGDGDDDDAAEDKARELAKPAIVRAEARALFAEAGVKVTPRLLKLIDLDEVDVDEDGEVSGLDEQIDELRDEYPQLFTKAGEDKPPARRRGGKLDTAGGRGKPSNGKSATERQVAAISGRK